MPGKKSTDGLWKPPYVCLARDPEHAWNLSGHFRADEPWDLWQTWEHVLQDPQVITEKHRTNGVEYIKEWRVYHRIYKRDIWYVGTRDLL
jgi:hypothetical protein